MSAVSVYNKPLSITKLGKVFKKSNTKWNFVLIENKNAFRKWPKGEIIEFAILVFGGGL